MISANRKHVISALITIAQENMVAAEEASSHGTKYLIMGKMETPVGITVTLKTVWIIETGDYRPRLVTAYSY